MDSTTNITWTLQPKTSDTHYNQKPHMDDTTKNVTWMLQQQNVTWTLQLKTYGLCNPKHHIKGDSKWIRTVGTIGRNRT